MTICNDDEPRGSVYVSDLFISESCSVNVIFSVSIKQEGSCENPTNTSLSGSVSSLFPPLVALFVRTNGEAEVHLKTSGGLF